MPVAFKNDTGWQSTFGSSYTFTTPGDTVAGDLILFCLGMVSNFSGKIWTPPSGVIQVATSLTSQATGIVLFAAIATAPGAVGYLFTSNTAGFVQQGVCATFTGADLIGLSIPAIGQGPTPTWTGGSVTLLGADGLVVTFVYADNAGAGVGMTIQADQPNAFSQRLYLDVDNTNSGPGASGTRTGTVTTAWDSIQIGLDEIVPVLATDNAIYFGTNC